MSYKVCVTDCRHSSYEIERKIIEDAGFELVLCSCVTGDDIIAQCGDADAIMLDMAKIDAKVIHGLLKCKVINRYGVGYDNVDVKAASEKGILVTNVPDYCMEDVSDHALALMMSCLRHVALRDREVRAGKWNIHARSFRLKGKTLGLLGFGRIARTLAHKVSGFDFGEILVYDPYVTEDACREAGAVKASLEEVLSKADIISIHMPVTDETKGMINRDRIALMKPDAILINTARGPLIDDDALVEALKNGRILEAGLDVHNAEPLPKGSPYLGLDNVTLTDHTGFSTVEGEQELKEKSARNVVDVLSGREPKYCVNRH